MYQHAFQFHQIILSNHSFHYIKKYCPYSRAEVGGFYYIAKDATVLRNALEEMGHPQPPTPIECDNTTGVGILNDSIRQRRSKAMDMRFYRIKDRQKLAFISDIRKIWGVYQWSIALTR
jgi:hypothetical protein